MIKSSVIRALAFSTLCVAAAAGHDDSTRVAGPLPLNDLGRGLHEGLQGGLYPHGVNMPPGRYALAGSGQAGMIAPLDAQGQRVPEGGRIGFLMLGTANTRMVAENLRQLAAADTKRSAAVVPVNGAAGTSIRRMAEASDRSWSLLPRLLAASGLTAAQVQVVWLDATSELVEQGFPDNARLLQADLATIVRIARRALPNLRLVWVSSGVYAGYGDGQRDALDSYESAFAVKWLIEEQIDAARAARAARAAGAAAAAGEPWLAWGPYLWADGETPRSDGLSWSRRDFAADGRHLSAQGGRRAAERLLMFLHLEAQARSWFLAHSDTACQRPALVSIYGLSRVGESAPSIASSALPIVSSPEPLRIEVSGAPASAGGIFLTAFESCTDALVADGPLLLSPEFARAVPVITDAAGRAWLELGRIPAAHDKACGRTLYVQFMSSADGALVVSPGLRLQGGH